MANSRKDHKGRKLREGESWRNDGRYSYRYTDIRTGKRQTIYAQDLPELREKEKQIAKDIDDNILTDNAIKKMTLNTLFERYLATRKLADSTRVNYTRIWNNQVRDEIGNIKVVQILPSHIKGFYSKLSKVGYAHSTIKNINTMIYPALEMAVDDDIIRKNPCKGCLQEFSNNASERISLTEKEQEIFLEFIKQSNVYSHHYPLIMFMIGTAVRCGEAIGLTWSDVDFKNREVNINHQLRYKKSNKSYGFYADSPKTDSGVRIIPMTTDVFKALAEQRKNQMSRGWKTDVEIDGYSDFVFSTKNRNPIMPSAVNSILLNIVNRYNKSNEAKEKLPHISAHNLRHTGCTRMAEAGVDQKVLQYIMGHSNISVTMEVYNHVSSERSRKEINKLEKIRLIG